MDSDEDVVDAVGTPAVSGLANAASSDGEVACSGEEAPILDRDLRRCRAGLAAMAGVLIIRRPDKAIPSETSCLRTPLVLDFLPCSSAADADLTSDCPTSLALLEFWTCNARFGGNLIGTLARKSSTGGLATNVGLVVELLDFLDDFEDEESSRLRPDLSVGFISARQDCTGRPLCRLQDTAHNDFAYYRCGCVTMVSNSPRGGVIQQDVRHVCRTLCAVIGDNASLMTSQNDKPPNDVGRPDSVVASLFLKIVQALTKSPAASRI